MHYLRKKWGHCNFVRFVDLSDTGVALRLFNFNDDDYDDYYNDDVDDDHHLLLTIQKPVHTEINRCSVQLNAQINNKNHGETVKPKSRPSDDDDDDDDGDEERQIFQM